MKQSPCCCWGGSFYDNLGERLINVLAHVATAGELYEGLPVMFAINTTNNIVHKDGGPSFIIWIDGMLYGCIQERIRTGSSSKSM